MSKPLWTLLLIFTGALALWRGGVGAFELYQYQRLATEVPAEVKQIEVVPKGSQYALEASYTYAFGSVAYAKAMLLPKPYYLNRASAEKAALDLQAMRWQAYLDPKEPRFSSLEPKFPLKSVFYGLCMVGVFVYFLYLRVHLELLSKAM